MSIEERFQSGFSVGFSYGLQSFCFLYAHHAEPLLAAPHHSSQKNRGRLASLLSSPLQKLESYKKNSFMQYRYL